jgi:host factor-I protein
MARAINLQDMFLNQVRKETIPVTVYLSGGVQVNGLVRGFDAFTVLIECPGKPTQLVYKHAMSSIVPSKELPAYKPGVREDI